VKHSFLVVNSAHSAVQYIQYSTAFIQASASHRIMVPPPASTSTTNCANDWDQDADSKNASLLVSASPSSSSPSSTPATVTSCTINLANTIVGAGMLGLPGAFGGTGYLGGMLLLFAGAAFSSHGLLLLSKCALLTQQQDMDMNQQHDNTGNTMNHNDGSTNKQQSTPPHQRPTEPSSFYTVARAAVPQYTILIDAAVALKCFGVATGYLITVSDCMVQAMAELLVDAGWMTNGSYDDDNSNNNSNHWITTMLVNRQFWTIVGIGAVLPLSFYKSLNGLQHASAVALGFVACLIIMVVSYAQQWGSPDPCDDASDGQGNGSASYYGDGSSSYYENADDYCHGPVVAFTSVSDTMQKLPIFIFAFTCQQNVFAIVNELGNANNDGNDNNNGNGSHASSTIHQKTKSVISYSISLALVVYLVVALEGYRTFGAYTKGDILLNYPQTPKVTLMRVCIAVMLTLHYPLQLDPSRRCLLSLIKVIREKYEYGKHRQGTNNSTSIQHQASSSSQSQSPPRLELERQVSSTLEDGDGSTTNNQRKEVEFGQSQQKHAPPHYTEFSVLSQNTSTCTSSSNKVIEDYGTGTANCNETTFSTANNDDDDQQDQEQHTSTMFYAVTAAFLGASWMLAMVVEDLGLVLALVGATGSTLVSYVLPGLIYVKLHQHNNADTTQKMDLAKLFMAYVQLGLGLIIMPVALYFVVMGRLSSSS
jgi:amino acid permease